MKLKVFFLPPWMEESKNHITAFYLWTSSICLQLIPMSIFCTPNSTVQYLPRYLSRNGLIASHNPLVSVVLFYDGRQCGEESPGRQLLFLCGCFSDIACLPTVHGNLCWIYRRAWIRPHWSFFDYRGHRGIGQVWFIWRQVVVVIKLC